MKKIIVMAALAVMSVGSSMAAEGPCERKYDSCGIVKKPPTVELVSSKTLKEKELQTKDKVVLAAEGPCERKYDSCGIVKKPPMA